jgi:diguanylate cyclase (GGDEF)-like protein
LAAADFEVLTAPSGEAAQKILTARSVDLILADQNLLNMSGVQLLEWVHAHFPQTVRLLMTGLGRFEDAVEAINHGRVYRYVFKPWRADELLIILHNARQHFLLDKSHAHLLEKLQQLNLDLEKRVRDRTRELQEMNHQLQQQNLMLQKLALTDSLTALPNRRAIEQLVRSEVRRRARYPNPLAMALVDVDHFKEVNSRYLLPGGDHILIGLTKTLINSVRTVDTVGRIGGEEFLVVAPETDYQGACALSERLRSAVECSSYTYKNAVIHITVSVGVGVVEANTMVEYEQLRHAAAAALQEAKSQGRNRGFVHAITMGSAPTHDNLASAKPADVGV